MFRLVDVREGGKSTVAAAAFMLDPGTLEKPFPVVLCCRERRRVLPCSEGGFPTMWFSDAPHAVLDAVL